MNLIPWATLTAGLVTAVGVTRLLYPIASMSSWTIEKQIYLNMELEQKRKVYRVRSHIGAADLPAWTQMAKEAGPSTERDRKTLGDTKINEQFNKALADKIVVWKGDMTTLEIDAIVNAANSELKGGGGVDGFIHKGAGPDLLAECKDIRGCPTGEARMTGGYLLPAKYVIHTVGPKDKSPTALTNCYKSCFALLDVNSIKTVAFPCIATGNYGFPNVDAAHIACRETRLFLENDMKSNGSIEKVIFCTFEPKDFEIYKSVAQLYFPID